MAHSHLTLRFMYHLTVPNHFVLLNLKNLVSSNDSVLGVLTIFLVMVPLLQWVAKTSAPTIKGKLSLVLYTKQGTHWFPKVTFTTHFDSIECLKKKQGTYRCPKVYVLIPYVDSSCTFGIILFVLRKFVYKFFFKPIL